MQRLFTHALSSVALGDPIAHGNIVMVPILGGPLAEREPAYLTLDQAFEREAIAILERSSRPVVSELAARNVARLPVLILDGEVLAGGRQDRVASLSVLVPAEGSCRLPVAGVEAGRWHRQSPSFAAVPAIHHPSGRAERIAHMTRSLVDAGVPQVDQSQVWTDIARKGARLFTASSTDALSGLFAQHANFAEACVEGLRPVPDQVGAIFLIAGRVVAMEVFDRTPALRRYLPKIVRGLALDALGRWDEQPAVASADAVRAAETFVMAASGPSTHVVPSPGIGVDVRLSAEGLSGAALVADSLVVHLVAFVR